MQYTTLLAALAFGSTAFGHMEMSFPAPLRGKTNPNAKNADFSMTAPLSGSAQFPCKGYQTDMADANGAGKPTATFTQGGDANFTIVGGAAHGGGSCQAALSYDQGKNFKVIHSFIGSCPLDSSSSFPFKIPSDAKEGTALFAWTWFNTVGNREMYMNCASVNIAKGSGDKPAVAFDQRPSLFVANIGTNSCKVKEGTEAEFPDPGPDVTKKETKSNAASLDGDCGAKGSSPAPAPGSGGGNSSPPAPAAPAAPSSPSAPAAPAAPSSPSAPASSPSQTIVPVNPPASSPTPAPSSGGGNSTPAAPAPGGAMTASTDGTCGGSKSCGGGACCSKDGFCGMSPQHCGTGCQSAFGKCGGAAKMIRGGNWA
ncbi:hypothetical protein HYALB_00011480 [Hymenoscyphus albidus]|uniref:Chitin-binding type-1 domain-containing protein n=1 Tax=Hymenoscyphus albidus TaxID=595503 RepID=A0A9N9LN68_9HELO|nr:hypothetical protein HYALB_00011480 [Hymenoscyphus albidus]